MQERCNPSALAMEWSYVFLALIHQYNAILIFTRPAARTPSQEQSPDPEWATEATRRRSGRERPSRQNWGRGRMNQGNIYQRSTSGKCEQDFNNQLGKYIQDYQEKSMLINWNFPTWLLWWVSVSRPGVSAAEWTVTDLVPADLLPSSQVSVRQVLGFWIGKYTSSTSPGHLSPWPCSGP